MSRKKWPFVKRLITVVCCSAAVFVLVWMQRPALTWDQVNAHIAATFPDLQSLTPQLAYARLQQAPAPIMLDVRTHAEYACSHISGAVWVGENSTWQPASADQAVIVYCAVGWRSAQMCERLRATGFTEVWNLQGGIFQWAQSGYPVQRRGHIVHAVHPYDARWGVLLDQALHPSAADE